MSERKAHERDIRIELRSLTKTFEKGGERIEVLKTLDMIIPQGTCMSIVGASGVGKSTLLHIIGTLDHPTSGTVLFNDEDVFAKDGRSLAGLRNSTIGFVFQFHHLLPEFTAAENVMMPAIIAGIDMAHARRQAEDALRAVGLGSRLAHQPGELSGGEQQRVAIARAIVMQPRLVLADEPTGNLDAHTGESIHDLLVELNRMRGITLVVVTHNLDLADRLSRKFRLTEGHLVELNPRVQSGGPDA